MQLHHRDTALFSIGDREHDGYAPTISGLCSGDDTFISICLDCGQAQGQWPKEPVDKLEKLGATCKCPDEHRSPDRRKEYCVYCGEDL